MASIGELIFIYEQTLLGTVVFYWLYLLFIKCKKRKWLEITDRYSYMIYLTHYIFLVGTDTAIVNCFQNTKIGCVAALVITLIFTVVLEFACRCGNMLIRKLEL